MKNILVLLLSLVFIQAESQTIDPVLSEEDQKTLIYPFHLHVTNVSIGSEYLMIWIYEGKRGYSDIVYLVYADHFEKIPIPKMFEKKRIEFAYKTEVSLFFRLQMNSKKKMAFHIREKRWMSVPKLQGHDGEDEIH